MNYRQYSSRFFYSFPIQLVIMHLKKNQIMMLYWLLLFGFITETIAVKFGIPFLFLDPEYMGLVGVRSFFIIGICLGAFIMAFNISSFMLNSFRFPFLATLSKTFLKYAHNNFIIPLAFVLLYVYKIYDFQHNSQLKSISEITLNIFYMFCGMLLVMLTTLRYFMVTNKDVYKLFGVQQGDFDTTSEIETYKKFKNRKFWRVDTYLVFPWRVSLVRDTRHYKNEHIQSVFKQNHINAAVVEIVVFVTFIILGLFRKYTFFRIPAAGSIMLLFTMIMMISGVFRYWMRAWANTAIVLLFLLLNFFSQFELFNPRNQCYGLNYKGQKALYTREALGAQVTDSILSFDKNRTIKILETWKSKWNQRGVEKPKMVLLNVSGGGLRSCVFTFRTMQVIDSTLNGDLLNYTKIICGSSGGMIGACYYRELFLNHHAGLIKACNDRNNFYLRSIGRDMLNSIVFSTTVADIFMNMQKFHDGKYSYVMDRSYAWEEQLNENTGNVLNKRLQDYVLPELYAEVPQLVISPTIINDGRALYISSQPVSYLLHQPNINNSPYDETPNGVELTRFFAKQDAYNLRLTSALRINSTFPYVMPAASLPSQPAIEVMDAGLRDNYGVMNSLQFLYTFKTWIKENTSGVVMIQIRDTYKKPKIENNSIKTVIEKLTAPMRNLSGNFLLMQDYAFDRELQYARTWYDGPLDFVLFQVPESQSKVSLSWHLTEKEKNYLKDAVESSANKTALEKLKVLLPPVSKQLMSAKRK